MDLYKEKIKHRKKFIEVLFFPIILTISIVPNFLDLGVKAVFVSIIGGIMAIVVFFPWVNKVFGIKQIRIDSEKLYVELLLAGIKIKTTSYRLSIIEKPISKRNEKAESYTAYGEVRIFGLAHHPEKLRKYDINPTTIHFEYEDSHIKIGGGLEAFNGKKVVDILKRHKKTKPNNLA
jgi:hypothetical protein